MITYKQLHHVSLSVTDIEKSKAFYKNILCLKELNRPDFDFQGAWFEVGEQQIHLIVFPESKMRNGIVEINTKEAHFALRVDNYFETLEWLHQHNVKIKENKYSKSGFAQIFCCDPDGNIIELNVEQKDLEQTEGE